MNAAVKVTYSISARLGGGGIGNIAHQATLGIFDAGWLARLCVSSNAQHVIPATLIREWGIVGRGVKYLAAKDRGGVVGYLESVLFDQWVARQLGAVNLFHGWNGMALQSLRQAKARGMVTVVERASSHPGTQARLLREEYARWDMSLHWLRWSETRATTEFAASDYITIPSAFVRESMLAAGVSEHKLIEIPFGVDPKRFSPAIGAEPHPFRALFVGQVSIRKGVPYLLDAWRRVAWQDAELWLVGARAADWTTIGQRWANAASVHWIPYSPNVAELYRQCDVFIFPTIEEGSALVTYEAMASGLPVITTPNAGSVVRDDAEGFLVPIRDVDALCARLEHLRCDDALRKRMGRVARARAEEYTWDTYRARLREAYQRILK
jgi:glycosyltransferase involved in cell wall biosynthesis